MPPRKRARPPACTSTSDSGDKLAEALLEQLECPVCMHTIMPPINQCKEGHLLCSSCSDSLPTPKKCPTCRVRLGSSRNLALEKMAQDLQMPCKYAERGCKHKLKYGDAAAHEASCDYRDMCCPSSGCKWKGRFTELQTAGC